MEHGVIKSSGESGGMISRAGNLDIRFSPSRIIGRDRKGLKAGEQVWFEVENSNNTLSAINIRKC